jgi:hypothetical protein
MAGKVARVGGSSMKVLVRKSSRGSVAFAIAAIAFGLLMGTAHATQRYHLDVCGTVTVDGQPTSNVVVVAWWCADDTVYGSTVTDGSLTNNYHLIHDIYFGPADQYGTYRPEVYLTYHYGDCPSELVTCEQVAEQHAVTDKPTFDVNIVCGPPGGGGHTPGFWQNKNGQALITPDDIVMLNDCCLRDDDGNHADFANKQQFKSWIKQRRAKNMAYQLSGQLAAMKLNVSVGFVNGDALVYINGGDTISINDLIQDADAALCADGTTFEGDPNRDDQETLKNALDAANNNLNWVNP